MMFCPGAVLMRTTVISELESSVMSVAAFGCMPTMATDVLPLLSPSKKEFLKPKGLFVPRRGVSCSAIRLIVGAETKFLSSEKERGFFLQFIEKVFITAEPFSLVSSEFII